MIEMSLYHQLITNGLTPILALSLVFTALGIHCGIL